tara:strand:+ start:498 stop:2483 length:1986 start_codon:yes stop_codon:yes gene_type:complete
MKHFLVLFNLFIVLSLNSLFASSSSSFLPTGPDDAPTLVYKRLNQLPKALITEKNYRDTFEAALSMGCACKQAYYTFLNLTMPFYQGWDWEKASLTGKSSLVIEINSLSAPIEDNKLTSTLNLTKVPLDFIQKNISALLTLAHIRYTIHQHLSNLGASFEDIEQGTLANLLYTYSTYRTEKDNLYRLICQKRGSSYPKRLHKFGVALNGPEMDEYEASDRNLRRALRKAYNANTLRSFGADYSPEMIQRALNRFHLKMQLIACLQGLVRASEASHISAPSSFHCTPQTTLLTKPLTRTQKRLRSQLKQREKQKENAPKISSKPSQGSAAVDINALMKQFGLEDEKRAPHRKKGPQKGRKQKKAQQKKTTPTKKKETTSQSKPPQSGQTVTQKAPSISIPSLGDNDDRDFILVSHKKTKKKATPQQQSTSSARHPPKISVSPPTRASDTPSLSSSSRAQEKKEEPKKGRLTLPAVSSLLDDVPSSFSESSSNDAAFSEEESFLKKAFENQEHRALQERLAFLEAAAQGDVNIKAALKMMERVKAAEDLLRALQDDPNSGESTRLLLNKLMEERAAPKKSIPSFDQENKSLKQKVHEQHSIIRGLEYEVEDLRRKAATLQWEASYQRHMVGAEQQEVKRLQQDNRLLRQQFARTQAIIPVPHY